MGPQPLDLIILGNFEATLQALQAAQPNGCAAETGRTDKQTELERLRLQREREEERRQFQEKLGKLGKSGAIKQIITHS